MKQEVYKQLQAEEKAQEFLNKYSKENFVAYAGKISNAHERHVNAFSETIDKHQIGNAYEDGQIQYVILKNEDTDTKVARFYERNDKKFILEDGCYKLVDNFVRVGACEYFYPGGERAGIEIYQGEGFPIDSIYFDPEGNLTTQSMFDVHFRKEHEFDRTMEFAPRIKGYNDLVNDLAFEYVYVTDRFDADDIRELCLSGKPAIYLDMIAQDIEEACAKDINEGRISKDSVDQMNKLFVYGENTADNALSIYLNPEVLERLGFDINDKQTVIPENPLGTYIGALFRQGNYKMDILRDIHQSKIPEYDYMNYIVDRDNNNRIVRKEMVKEANTYREYFYPDGKLCMSGDEEDKPRYFDSYGRITHYSKAADSFIAEWGLNEKYIELEVESAGKNAKVMNAYLTGFDSSMLFMEIDGKKVTIEDNPQLPKGLHTIRLHLKNSEKLLVPQNLFDGCKNVKGIKMVGINDNSLFQINEKGKKESKKSTPKTVKTEKIGKRRL